MRVFLFSPTYSRHSVLSLRSLDKNLARQDGGFMFGEKMKHCSRCKEWKSEEDFYKNKASCDGLNSICKPCKLVTNKIWKDNNLEKTRAYSRKARKKWYTKNKDNVLATLRVQRENDPLYKIRKALRMLKTPKPKIEWRHENPDKIHEYNHKYYLANKNKFAAIAHNRRARCNGGKVTVEQWEALKRKYNYTCLCCKRREPEIALTRDHVLPLKLEGKNIIENIQPLCKSCNSKKHAKYIDYR